MRSAETPLLDTGGKLGRGDGPGLCPLGTPVSAGGAVWQTEGVRKNEPVGIRCAREVSAVPRAYSGARVTGKAAHQTLQYNSSHEPKCPIPTMGTLWDLKGRGNDIAARAGKLLIFRSRMGKLNRGGCQSRERPGVTQECP